MATPLSYKNWTNKVIESKIKMMQNFRKFKIQNIQKEDGSTRYLCYFKDNVGKE